MSRNDPNRNRIFIGHLNPDARTKDLDRFFRENGFKHVKDINVKLGYAFVEFEDKRDADDAVYELDKKNFFGSRITVEHAKGTPREDGDQRGDRGDQRGDRGDRKPFRSDRDRDRGGGYRGRGGGHERPYNTEWRIIVTNLSSRVGWHELKDFFRGAGEVTYTKANKERMGEGVVEFKTHKEMQKAMKKFDGAEFFDRKLKLIDDSPGPPRSRSRSRSRKRSRSRSRSRRRSRSKSRSKSKSPKNKSRSRSKSPKAASRSRSRSKSKSKSPLNGDKSPARSRSRSKSRSKSKSVEKEMSRSRSKSRSPEKNERRSASKSKSRSRSRSKSKSKSPMED